MKDDVTKTPNGEVNTGKFKSAEELLSAYNALEREFTKRCQLISKLQAALSSRDGAQEKASGEKVGSANAETASKPVTAELSENADGQISAALKTERAVTDAKSEIDDFINRRAEKTDAEYAAQYAEELSAIPEVMAACIEKYKRKILTAGVVPSPEGMAVIVPAKRPKTLADAKLLADSMLDKF